MEKEVKSIREIAKSAQNSQIKGMEQLIEPQKSIAFIKEIFKKYEKSSQEKEREIKELKDNINILN